MTVEIDFDGTWREVSYSHTYSSDGKIPHHFNSRTYDDKQVIIDNKPLLHQSGKLAEPEALPAMLDIDA